MLRERAENLYFAPIHIGLRLTLTHLISIPATNIPVKSARSTEVTVHVRNWALEQLGGAICEATYLFIGVED